MTALLEIKNLHKHFTLGKETIQAVKGVSFSIYPGEALGLVGESGSGKSTLGQMILRLSTPTEGQIFFEGKDMASFSEKECKDLRKKLQIIFQDPSSSLNPRMNVRQTLMEPFVIHNLYTKEEREKKIEELLYLVGLEKSFLNRYPHELSGGQKQRVAIARALSLSPKCVVCDEATSSLDVSIQAQIVHLLKDLQEKFQLSYLFISHNLHVVHYLCQRIAVLYLGKIVEIGSKEQIYNTPVHPYTKMLLSTTFHPALAKKDPSFSLSSKEQLDSLQSFPWNETAKMYEVSPGHLVSSDYLDFRSVQK